MCFEDFFLPARTGPPFAPLVPFFPMDLKEPFAILGGFEGPRPGKPEGQRHSLDKKGAEG